MIQNIQTMRVLFTFLVVTAHLENVYAVVGLRGLATSLGHGSVDGFIAVSAFLVSYTNVLRPRPPLSFFRRRIARLVPLYWFMTLTVAALVLVAPQLFNHTVVTAETLAKSLLFIPYEKYPGVIEPIVFVGWTMNLFAFCFVVHALSLRFAGRWAWLSTSGFLFSLVVIGWVFQPADPVLAFFTGPYLLSFVAGQLLCEWWRRVRDKISPSGGSWWFRPAWLAVALAAFALGCSRDYLFPELNPRVVGSFFAAILIGAVFVLDRAGWSHRGKIRDRLADASFAIYLTHYFVTQAAAKAVEVLHIEGPLPIAGVLVAAYASTAVVGVLVHRFLETPLDGFVRMAWQRAKAVGAS